MAQYAPLLDGISDIHRPSPNPMREYLSAVWLHVLTLEPCLVLRNVWRSYISQTGTQGPCPRPRADGPPGVLVWAGPLEYGQGRC